MYIYIYHNKYQYMIYYNILICKVFQFCLKRIPNPAQDIGYRPRRTFFFVCFFCLHYTNYNIFVSLSTLTDAGATRNSTGVPMHLCSNKAIGTRQCDKYTLPCIIADMNFIVNFLIYIYIIHHTTQTFVNK